MRCHARARARIPFAAVCKLFSASVIFFRTRSSRRGSQEEAQAQEEEVAHHSAAGHSAEADALEADGAEGAAGHRRRAADSDRVRCAAVPLSEKQYAVQDPAAFGALAQPCVGP